MSQGKHTRVISIEGCMGAGKTTLSKKLGEVLGASVLAEQTDRHPFIAEFYEAPEIYAIETEIAFLLIHYHQMVRAAADGTLRKQVVTDFALDRDLVFARLTLKGAADLELFKRVYANFSERIIRPDLVIFLRAPVELLARRMLARGRSFEKKISLAYIESVNEALEAYFVKEYQGDKLILDAVELDAANNPDFVSTVVARLGQKDHS